jgi:hypothetical protein
VSPSGSHADELRLTQLTGGRTMNRSRSATFEDDQTRLAGTFAARITWPTARVLERVAGGEPDCDRVPDTATLVDG